MIYPYLTLNDGTEYTHSEMKAITYNKLRKFNSQKI